MQRTTLWCVLGLLMAGMLIATEAPARGQVEGQDYLWLEGEKPSTSSIPVTPAGTSHDDFLSQGQWLNIVLPPQRVAQLPQEGVTLGYRLHVPAPGTWELWDRIGYEFARSPFAWRMDDGPWHEVKPSDLTTDLMELDVWCEVAWLKVGTPELTAGDHTLTIRVPRPRNAKGQFERLLYASDALVLARPGVFHPNSCYRPGQVRGAAIDQAAAAKVFAAPVSQGAQRAEVNLDGPWQIARADEELPPFDIAVPMEQPKAAGQYLWTGIAVPSDRNQARPDLLFAHRLWYRARIDVPAADAGKSFHITFPQNNLNTTVYVNGKLCGFNKNPFARFDIDLTPGIKPGQVNEVWVGIRDAWYGYATSPDNPMQLRRRFNLPVRFFGQGFQDLAYPIWHAPQSGILATPVLTVAGAVLADDVFVRPSVAEHRLDAEVTLQNTTSAATRGEVVCQAVDASGQVAHTFAGQPFELAPGQRRTVTVGGPWTDAKLWWPDSPTLYTLRTTIQVGGQPEDISTTTFGFRQWSWQGHDFKLNGVVWHGWADCFTESSPQAWLKFYRAKHEKMMRFWGTSWMGLTPDQALDFFDRNGVVVRRSGMLDGEMIGYMAIEQDPALRKLYHSEIKMQLLNNWRDQMVAQVKGERNHPSIMIWSIENEWLYINCLNLYGRLMDQFEAQETRTADAVMAADPTRPVMSDGGAACKDQSLPVCGNHYVAGNWTQWPALAYEANPTGGGRGRWVWDQKRPRFLGEDLYITGNHPEFSTFGGDAAFTGKQGLLPAAGLLIRMAQQGYRWAQYGAWQFWKAQDDTDQSEYHYFAPRVALVKQWDWNFTAGATVQRTVGIFNDTHDASPITFSWVLNVNGQPAVHGEPVSYDIAPGGRKILDVSIPVPPVADEARGELVLRLSVAGKEVWRDTKAVTIFNTNPAQHPAGLAGLKAGACLLYDTHGQVAQFLRSRGIAFTPVAALDKLPADGRVLIIGPDMLSESQATSSALSAYAAGGRAVIVLEQKNPLKYQALPAAIEAANNEGRVGFVEDPSLPVFAGLRSANFFTWGDDQILYRNAYIKPTSGARSLLECDQSLKDSALVEVPAGQGVMLLSQLLVGQKLDSEPAAQKLLWNLIDYAASYKAVVRPAVVVAQDDPPLEHALQGMGLQASVAPDPLAAIKASGSVVVMSATPEHLKVLADHLEAVQQFTVAGGWIVFNGLTPPGLPSYDRIVGVDHMIRPFGSTRPTLTKDGPMAIERVLLAVPRNPLTAGLTSADVALYSSKRIFPWTQGNYTLPNEFTYVVDLQDIAPFATSDFAHWGNATNGFTSADGWPLVINFPVHPDGAPYDIHLSWPKAQTITSIVYQQNLNYLATTKLNVIFDGDRKNLLSFPLKVSGDPQTLTINPPRPATKMTLELAAYEPRPGKPQNYGIDNIWINAQRPADFEQRVKPMLNIGALVEYPRGQGGIILCNVNYQATDDSALNVQRKQKMLATILRNLDAPFKGAKMVIAGANLQYTPIDLSQVANQFRDEQGWFGDARHTFKDLPVGRQTFAGVAYDVYQFATSPVPTAVMLGGPRIPGHLPDAVKGIAVNRKADALFFLQAARIDRPRTQQEKKAGTFGEVGRYVVHYADGQTAEVPIRAEQSVANYIQQGQPQPVPGAQVAWSAPYDDQKIAVAYSQQWTNPRPNVAITTVDLVAGPDHAGVPALLALTAANTPNPN